MQYPSTHRIDRQKEQKRLIKIIIGIVVFTAIICSIPDSTRVAESDEWKAYVVAGLIFLSIVLIPLITSHRNRVRYYQLELIDDDHFNITTKEGTKKYSPSKITTIEFYKNGDVRRVNLKEGRYPADIQDNLENYATVAEYFKKMGKRLGRGIMTEGIVGS